MKYLCFKPFKSFLLFTALIFALAGCGSSSSTANTETGSIVAKLVWNSTEVNGTEKTLYKAPDGVDKIKIEVLDGNLGLVTKDFSASAGTGTINGIPAGIGLTVKVQGLVSGSLVYERAISNVTIIAGKVTDLGVITMASVTTTTELPVFGIYSTKYVTLTASTPATIYYTTNGKEPVFANKSTSFGSSPIQNIFIKKQPTVSTFLKFFSINSFGTQETTKTKEYIFP